MRHSILLLALLGGAVTAGCNDDDSPIINVSVETEPNDTFASADNLGSVDQATAITAVAAEVDANDTGTGTDLLDYFLFTPDYTGQVQVTVTPTEAASDILVTEVLTASTDGAVGNSAGAGITEILIVNCTANFPQRVRVETTLADTAYTVDVDPVAPFATAPTGPSVWVDQVDLQIETGDVETSSALIVPGTTSN